MPGLVCPSLFALGLCWPILEEWRLWAARCPPGRLHAANSCSHIKDSVSEAMLKGLGKVGCSQGAQGGCRAPAPPESIATWRWPCRLQPHSCRWFTACPALLLTQSPPHCDHDLVTAVEGQGRARLTRGTGSRKGLAIVTKTDTDLGRQSVELPESTQPFSFIFISSAWEAHSFVPANHKVFFEGMGKAIQPGLCLPCVPSRLSPSTTVTQPRLCCSS